jgi:amino-acid N-acetyltransferase
LVRIRGADSTDILRLTDFLKNNSLPTIGLQDCLGNFQIALDENGSWIGVAGYEMYGQSALLRSVAVDKPSRNQGHGRVLVDAILANARNRGVRIVYLLTETAEQYFKHLGFDSVERDCIEDAVKNSPEFTECGSTARLMRKTL